MEFDTLTEIQLNDSWKELLKGEFEQLYMQNLKAFLFEQKTSGIVVYPEEKDIFNALNSTPIDAVKVVILGQDPYHGPNQAHGLCFSVNKGVKIPPSLRNIYKELHNDIGFDIPKHGYLQSWANQGILLLNSVLTVSDGLAASHQNKGWERFTDKIIEIINQHNKHVVYMLWGKYAHKKGANIDANKNLVLKSAHPSPLSAHRGFLGCKHFSQCNEYLQSQRMPPIVWDI
jgi:uracil-DNA glycosylase